MTYVLPDHPTNRGRLNQTIMTANKGAAEVRHKILRKMRQMDNEILSNHERWNELRDYIKGMAKRAGAKKGGLGRR